MRQPIRNLLILAAVSAAPVLTGCSTSDDGYVARREPLNRPSLSSRLSAVNAAPAGPAVAKDIPLFGNSNPDGTGGGGPADPSTSQLVDTTGIRVTELPSVQRALAAPGHWQQAVGEVEVRVDAPDLKRNLREGMAVVAPRVARALIDYKGETAIVTVAVYRDPNPTIPNPGAAAQAQPSGNGQAQGSQSLGGDPAAAPDRATGAVPATQPAPGAATTQPAYTHAAVAIAFEGFAGRLDPSFIPRVLADQPRTPDDGREPIDPNLVLDRQATSYVLFRSTRDGLVAGQVTHDELRRELADAAERATPAPPPATTTRPAGGTQPGTAPSTTPRPGELSGEYNPLGTGGGGGVVGPYDAGEPRYPDGYGGGYYDDGYYDGGYAYPGDYYGGRYYDPYLYDLYGSRWGSPYFITRSGFHYNDYYWGSPWYRHHHNHRRYDRDGDGRGDNGRVIDGRDGGDGGGIIVRGGGTRGKVPWGNPPVVSPTNPASPARQTAAAAGRTAPTPRVTPAVRGNATAARDATPGSRPPLVAPSITGGRPTPAPAEFVGPRALTDTQRAAAAGRATAAAAADSERASSAGSAADRAAAAAAAANQATFRKADGDTITFAPSAAARRDEDKDDAAGRARPAGGSRLLIPPARAPQPVQRPEAVRRPAAADNGSANDSPVRQLGAREITPPRLGSGRSDRGDLVGPRAIQRGDSSPARVDSSAARGGPSRGDASPSRSAGPRLSDSAARGNSAARTESGSAGRSDGGSRSSSGSARSDSGGSRSSSSSSSSSRGGDGGGSSGNGRNR